MATVVLVGGDLTARARVFEAAERASRSALATSVDRLVETLRSSSSDLLILDLDEQRDDKLLAVGEARAAGLAPERVIGYYSHVDTATGEAARAAGCEAFPRGRFWRSLDDILRD
jgi:hypothetical protein